MCIEEIRDNFPFPESDRVLDAVRSYRDYWKPENTSHVLLAESHVWTSENHLNHLIINQNENLINLNNELQNGYPRKFVRYVYCLAYGENDLLNVSHNMFSNSGTVAYWKLFYSCINDIRDRLDDEVPNNIIFNDISKKGMPILERRITNKLNLLHTLKNNGIWLVDSSIFGINYLVENLRKKIIQKSWELIIQNLLRTINNDFKILTIGKTVHKALNIYDFYNEHNVDVVDQPMVRNRNKNINTFSKTFEFCNDLL